MKITERELLKSLATWYGYTQEGCTDCNGEGQIYFMGTRKNICSTCEGRGVVYIAQTYP